MKTKTIPTAYQSYQSLKFDRIRHFSKPAFQKIIMCFFVLLVVIAIVLQITVSKAQISKLQSYDSSNKAKYSLNSYYKIASTTGDFTAQVPKHD